jgi:hypothetical protein
VCSSAPVATTGPGLSGAGRDDEGTPSVLSRVVSRSPDLDTGRTEGLHPWAMVPTQARETYGRADGGFGDPRRTVFSPEWGSMEALAGVPPGDPTPGMPGEKRTEPGATQVAGGAEAWKAKELAPGESDLRWLAATPRSWSVVGRAWERESRRTGTATEGSAPRAHGSLWLAVTIRTSRIPRSSHARIRQIGR